MYGKYYLSFCQTDDLKPMYVTVTMRHSRFVSRDCRNPIRMRFVGTSYQKTQHFQLNYKIYNDIISP